MDRRSLRVRSKRDVNRLQRKYVKKMRKARSEEEWWAAFVVVAQVTAGQAIAEAMNDGVSHHDACRLVEREINDEMREITPGNIGWVPQFAITYEGDAVVGIRPYAEERERSE